MRQIPTGWKELVRPNTPPTTTPKSAIDVGSGTAETIVNVPPGALLTVASGKSLMQTDGNAPAKLSKQRIVSYFTATR